MSVAKQVHKRQKKNNLEISKFSKQIDLFVLTDHEIANTRVRPVLAKPRRKRPEIVLDLIVDPRGNYRVFCPEEHEVQNRYRLSLEALSDQRLGILIKVECPGCSEWFEVEIGLLRGRKWEETLFFCGKCREGGRVLGVKVNSYI
jgi:hypothetical protein